MEKKNSDFIAEIPNRKPAEEIQQEEDVIKPTYVRSDVLLPKTLESPQYVSQDAETQIHIVYPSIKALSP